MQPRAVLLAAALAMAPLGARGADLVVWWEQGFYAEEDEAVREIIAAFEQKTGKQVELVFSPQAELPDKILEAIEAARSPDFAYSCWLIDYFGQLALEDRLVDLSEAVGSLADLFDADMLGRAMWLNARTGRKALYGLPIGRSTNHIHVWKSLLESAGFTLADIPKEWEAFWSFWCDEVQPAVRQALGRDDVWGIGLPMSVEGFDTATQFSQFRAAYQADYVTRDGKLVIDDPKIRHKLVKAIDGYTAVHRKGCTPPGSLTWANIDNNKAFHAQGVIMTPNDTLSIPNALKRERPDDYYENMATIEWPLGPSGEPFPIFGDVFLAMAFKGGGNVSTAEEFVRFLVSEGWLVHYLDFSGERLLPALPALFDQPFWLDPGDPHRMAAVMQVTSRPLLHNYAVASGNWRHGRVIWENVWAKAIHRVATEGISPEQAVNEAIARVKQLLSE